MMTKTAPRKNTLWTIGENSENNKWRLDGQRGDGFLYLVGSKSWSQKYDIRVDRMMDSDVAKPLRMLSAYLMTAAMTRPPSAWRNNKHTDADGQRHRLCWVLKIVCDTLRFENKAEKHVSSWQQSEHYLQNHHGPGDCVVALEHPRLPYSFSIVGHHPKNPKDQPKHAWKHRGTH